MRSPRDIGKEMARLGREMGQQRRQEAEKRKSEFLHTRVSDELKAAVRLRAEELGIPSSILIRNILVAYFQLSPAEQASGESFELNISGELAGIDGWQEFITNRPQPCSACDREITKGSKAFRGINDKGGFLKVFCKVCVSEYLR